MPTKMIDLEDGELHVEMAGKGAPVVLLHGFALDLRMWDPQFEVFSTKYWTIRYDLRGFGKSSRPGGGYSHATDLVTLFNKLEIEKAIVIGLSLGSNIALDLVSHYPDRVAGLILASPSLPGYPWRWSGDRPREKAAILAKEHGLDTAKTYWSEHQLFASARENPVVGRQLSAMMGDYDGWHWLHDDLQKAIKPIHPVLGRIAAPALVLSGDHDIEAYREIASIIARRVPDARMTRIAEAGHMLNLEAPRVFNESVLQFCTSLESAIR